MKTTSLAVTTLAALALALAGCTTTEPGETETGCTPENATIEFGDATVGEVELLGVQVIEYSDGATDSTMSTEVVADAGYPDAALETVGVTDQQRDAWHAGLLERARGSKAVAAGFAASPLLSEEPYVEITTPEDGRYVVSVMGPLVELPVTVECEKLDPAVGTIVGVDAETIEAVPLLCVEGGDSELGDSIPSVTAREYCAKP